MCQQLNGDQRIDVSEEEPGMSGQHLHLLSVIRGLESLEQPSKVSLITGSRYVGRGIRHSLQVWKDNDWQWEHFGVMRPIKHKFLWQRIERAMQHHDVECRVWSFDSAKDAQPDHTTSNASAIRPNAIRPGAVEPSKAEPVSQLEPVAQVAATQPIATQSSEQPAEPQPAKVQQAPVTPQEQVTTWANELAARLVTMGLSPVTNYAIQ